jgi:hypothetical protein
MKVLLYYAVLGAAGSAVRLWLQRALDATAASPDGLLLARPSLVAAPDLEDEVERLARELELDVGSMPDAPRRVCGRGISIDYRVGDSFASLVRIERSPTLPSFTLLPHPDVSPLLPRRARRQVKALIGRRALAATERPFVGWAPPLEGRWEELRRASRRVAAEVEVLEHEDGAFTAWIVSWSPEQAAEQIRRVLRFTDLRLPSSAPYR